MSVYEPRFTKQRYQAHILKQNGNKQKSLKGVGAWIAKGGGFKFEVKS